MWLVIITGTAADYFWYTTVNGHRCLGLASPLRIGLSRVVDAGQESDKARVYYLKAYRLIRDDSRGCNIPANLPLVDRLLARLPHLLAHSASPHTIESVKATLRVS